MWEYNEKVKDHFENPRNVGEVGRVDGEGQVGSLACGDALRLTIQVDKSQNRIEDAKFQTFGCASAIASSSALTEMVKGKTLDQALELTNQDIAEFLGGLPKEKMHCSVMGQEALEAAIANYRGETPRHVEGRVICECFGVTDKEIERVIRENNITTVEDVTAYTKAGGGCGRCIPELEEILKAVRAAIEPVREEAPAKLTTLQKIKLIEETIQTQIAPALMQDGGDIELVDIDGDEVMVKLKGNCASCPSSKRTLADFVTQELRDKVAPGLTVKEVRL